MNTIQAILTIVTAGLAIGGLESAPAVDGPSPPVNAASADNDVARREAVERRKRLLEQNAPRRLPEVVSANAAEAQSVDLPGPLANRILADAARRTGQSNEALRVIRSESVTWPDGSLGCPEKGMSYPQLQVSGYRVVVEAGASQLDYRVPSKGDFRLCQPLAGLRAAPERSTDPVRESRPPDPDRE